MDVELDDSQSVAEFFTQLGLLMRHATKVRITVDFPSPPVGAADPAGIEPT